MTDIASEADVLRKRLSDMGQRCSELEAERDTALMDCIMADGEIARLRVDVSRVTQERDEARAVMDDPLNSGEWHNPDDLVEIRRLRTLLIDMRTAIDEGDRFDYVSGPLRARIDAAIRDAARATGTPNE